MLDKKKSLHWIAVVVAVVAYHAPVISAWAPLPRLAIEKDSFPRRASLTMGVSRCHWDRLGSVASSSSTMLHLHLDREADLLEQMMGGERYEMNALPDSMMDTTVFVGNLNEFVSDDDLSMLFQTVSSLHTGVPACVVRKPDMSSLEYGFVSFPSVQEKEVSIEL